ncbi:MAG: 4-phosphoerythronate dehydrogenase PdxB [Bacteroidaceae bacterium]|nr:4-phosphoerythronate dehydrogenase PdxB [Bacteroidaceae bacterium]
MKVIVDNKIPYIKGIIERIAGEVVYLPGNAFTPQEVKDADALIVRTRTLCNRDLLEGSRIKFIATATIGFDHIDTAYCQEAGITWTNCPGCNASSVEQYVHSVLLLLKREKNLCLEGATIGVVGVGHVGSKVTTMASKLGMRVLLNDPPRADKGEEGFVDLQTIARECDAITFHTPLNREGVYRTFHLADEAFFNQLERSPYIINSSRGEVVETQALLRALEKGQVKEAVIDTWENEPDIDLTLLREAFIATPHIAGYSADGKANATRMSLEALCRFFGIEANFKIVPPLLPEDMAWSEDKETAYLQLYNPMRDSEWLKAEPEKFEWFRGNYPLRRELF